MSNYVQLGQIILGTTNELLYFNKLYSSIAVKSYVIGDDCQDTSLALLLVTAHSDIVCGVRKKGNVCQAVMAFIN